MNHRMLFVGCLLVGLPLPTLADESEKREAERQFQALDVFKLEWASDPQISPDGKSIIYVRNFMDVMSDRRRSNLWVAVADGSDHRPLTTGLANDASPRWSPDGDRLLYTSSADGSTQTDDDVLTMLPPEDDLPAVMPGEDPDLLDEFAVFAAEDSTSIAASYSQKTSEAPAIISVVSRQRIAQMGARSLLDILKDIGVPSAAG